MIDVCATIFLGVALITLFHLRWRKIPIKVIYIVVLGDVGRSPRMQYHACSLAKSGCKVILIGYPGSKPHKDVLYNQLIQLVHLPTVPSFLKGLPSPLNFISQVLMNSVTLLVCMVYHVRPSHILVQNPPAIPAMLISWLVCRLRGSRLIYDWHNYGYSIMALGKGGPNHPLVRIYKRYEEWVGTLSDDNICVTESMKEDLMTNWNIRAITLYDRPPSMFRRLNDEERRQFLKNSDFFGEDEINQGHALVLSSTSWTPDEDFGILLQALDAYNEKACLSSCLPFMLCVVTGKGPMKEHYKGLINEKKWSKVRVVTPWLEAEDYPRLLGSGDLGICLHTSSSGLDLPMKVVDMFGCQLPVCAVHYKCIGELVEDKVTGLTFKSPEELAAQLEELLTNFPNGCDTLKRLRLNLESTDRKGWDENWKKNVSHIFS